MYTFGLQMKLDSISVEKKNSNCVCEAWMSSKVQDVIFDTQCCSYENSEDQNVQRWDNSYKSVHAENPAIKPMDHATGRIIFHLCTFDQI